LKNPVEADNLPKINITYRNRNPEHTEKTFRFPFDRLIELMIPLACLIVIGFNYDASYDFVDGSNLHFRTRNREEQRYYQLQIEIINFCCNQLFLICFSFSIEFSANNPYKRPVYKAIKG